MIQEAINPPASLEKILRDTEKLGFGMASEPLTGALLRTLVASKRRGAFLELGTGTGLSTAWILDGMDSDASLVTVDNDEACLGVARANLGHDRRLQIVCADGDSYLLSLEAREFDLIFADTWPGKYRLLDATLALL